MDNTSECIECEMDNAYFNGMCYECPDCDHIWGCIKEEDFEEGESVEEL